MPLALPIGAWFLITATFLASIVEMVEAVTIILAVGVTRGWRSTIIGTVAALITLAVVTAILGPALTLIPIHILQLVVGTLLLIFGLQWLRKAILRATGFKGLHDEEALYKEHMEEARRAGQVVREGIDWYAFTLSFKGVFLEGLEVVFIVLTFGTSAALAGTGDIAMASVGAVAAVVLVSIVGVIAHRPLSRVPENQLKFAVGLLLITFGTFWAAEGVGVEWPLEDTTILILLGLYTVVALAIVAVLKGQRAAPIAAVASGTEAV
jgi:uncharacterized membrane protein